MILLHKNQLTFVSGLFKGSEKAKAYIALSSNSISGNSAPLSKGLIY